MKGVTIFVVIYTLAVILVMLCTRNFPAKKQIKNHAHERREFYGVVPHKPEVKNDER